MTDNTLYQKFQNDLRNIAINYINLFGLKYRQDIPHLSDPLIRWLDFSLRYIQSKPRQIIFSNKFPNCIPNEASEAFRMLQEMILKGEDINPYQGKGLIINDDTSAKKKRDRTDLLWANWGILHLHLNDQPIPADEKFSIRSGWLLFCIVNDDYLICIDIRHHDEKKAGKKIKVFSNPELVKTVVMNWPEYVIEVNGILPGKKGYTDEEIDKLWQNGIATMLIVDGKIYMPPGLSITSAATSTRVTLIKNNAIRYVRELTDLVCHPKSQFYEQMMESNIHNPDYSLVVISKGLAVFESKSSITFLLPRKKDYTPENKLGILNDLFAPEWAISQFHP